MMTIPNLTPLFYHLLLSEQTAILNMNKTRLLEKRKREWKKQIGRRGPRNVRKEAKHPS